MGDRSFDLPLIAAARLYCSARFARPPPLRGYPTRLSFRSGRVVTEIAFQPLLARVRRAITYAHFWLRLRLPFFMYSRVHRRISVLTPRP